MEENLITADLYKGVGMTSPLINTTYGTPDTTDYNSIMQNSFSSNLRNSLTDTPTNTRYIPKTYNTVIGETNASPFYEYGRFSTDDRYNQLNDGSLVPKYDFYKPGANNEELNAQMQNQGASSVWGRGINRFVNQVGTSFLGGLASLPVGIVNAIGSGSVTALYDNDFTKWLDDLDTRSKSNNGIYYSQAEQDLNLFEQLGTKRMWADTVLGGAAFTVGTIGSEALWAVATGGSANVAKWGARGFQRGLRTGIEATEMLQKGSAVGKVMSNVNNAIARGNTLVRSADDIAMIGANVVESAVSSANNASRLAKTLNTGRFMMTSSGYEAGFEARQMKNEALQAFNDYYKSLGREATIEERERFNEQSDEASKNVGIANMALLSVSNMVMLGSIFNIPNPIKSLRGDIGTSGNYLTKKLFGYGSEMVEGVEKSVSRNVFQKVLNGVYKVGQNTATEGIWEEGGQGVASKWMQNYVEATYNPTKAQKALEESDSVWSPYLKEAFSEQYGTKEGLKEVLVGGIIGSVFGIGSLVRAKEYSNLDTRIKFNNEGKSFASEYSKNALAVKMGSLSRNISASEELSDAVETGQPIQATLKAKEQLISKLDEAHSLGRDSSFVKTMIADVENMDNSQIKNTYGVTEEEVETFKRDTIDEINRTAESYSKNREFTNNLAFSGAVPGLLEQGSPEKFASAMAYTLTMGMSARNMAKEARDTLQELFATSGDKSLSKNTDILTLLSSVSEEINTQLSDIIFQAKENRDRIAELTKKLTELDNTRTQNTNYLQERTQLVEELNSSTLEETEIRAKADAVISLQNKNIFDNDSVVSFNDILEGVNFDEYKNAINEYKVNSPQLYNNLAEAVYTLEESTNMYKEFDSLMREFASPEINIKVFRGGLFSSPKDSDINTETYDLLQTLSDKNALGEPRNFEEVLNDGQYVTSREYAEFIDQENKDFLPENIVRKISDKIILGKQLTRLESFLNNQYNTQIENYSNTEKVDRVLDKIENGEELTVSEQNTYDENEQIINDVLEDPLQYSKGEDIESVTNETTNEDVISKILNSEPLTPLERAHYENNTEEIDKEISERKEFTTPSEFQKVSNIVSELISKEEVERLRELNNKKPYNRNKLEELDKARSKKTPPLVKIARLERQTSNMRTESEEVERQGLLDKMYNYNVADGSEYNGWNLLDWLTHTQSLENYEYSQENVKNGLTDEETKVEVSTVEQKQNVEFEESEEANLFPAITQVTENVLVSFKKGIVKLHHISFSDIRNLLKSRNPEIQVLDENGLETDGNIESRAGATMTARVVSEDGEIQDMIFRIPTNKSGSNKNTITGKPIELHSTTQEDTLNSLLGISIVSSGALKTDFYPAYLENEDGSKEIIQSSEEFRVDYGNGYSFDAESASALQQGNEVEFTLIETPFNSKIQGKTLEDDFTEAEAKHERIVEELNQEEIEAKGADNPTSVINRIKELGNKVNFANLFSEVGRVLEAKQQYQTYLNEVSALESLRGKKVLSSSERRITTPSNFSERYKIITENSISPKTSKKTTAIKAKIGNFVDMTTGKFYTVSEIDNILINEAIRAIPTVEKPSQKVLNGIGKDMFENDEYSFEDLSQEALLEYMPSTKLSREVSEKREIEEMRYQSEIAKLEERRRNGSTSKLFQAMSEILVTIPGTKKVVGRLKASYNLSDNLAELRDFMTREYMNGNKEVRVSSNVLKTFIGAPITKVENEVVKKYDATDSYSNRGVINNGEISAVEEMDGVITTFIDNISNKFKDVDIPFIVFTDKISGKKVAYPATVENNSVSGAVDEVLEIISENLPILQTATRINEILFNWGVQDVRLTTSNITKEGIFDDVIARLQDGQETFSVDKFLSDKPFRVFTTVDINGQAFLTPKSVISLEGLSLNTPNSKIEGVVSDSEGVGAQSLEESKGKCKGGQLTLF